MHLIASHLDYLVKSLVENFWINCKLMCVSGSTVSNFPIGCIDVRTFVDIHSQRQKPTVRMYAIHKQKKNRLYPKKGATNWRYIYGITCLFLVVVSIFFSLTVHTFTHSYRILVYKQEADWWYLINIGDVFDSDYFFQVFIHPGNNKLALNLIALYHVACKATDYLIK